VGFKAKDANAMYIFALKNDLLLVLGNLEAKRKVKYTRCGRLTEPEPEIWKRAADLPKLGQAACDQEAGCDTFLIMEEDCPIRVKTMTMFDGDDRFDVEQPWNPHSVFLSAGGEWKDGTIISGTITTISSSPVAHESSSLSSQEAFREGACILGWAGSACSIQSWKATYARYPISPRLRFVRSSRRGV
jgi:hypothetical protein